MKLKFINSTQASFVLGYQISDNIFLLQEMVQNFNITKGRKGFVAWKIDLSKAYDKLSQTFLSDILKELGISGTILELFEQCFETITYKAIVNDELPNGFVSKREFVKGTLSPRPFVLAMEKFSQIVEVEVDSNNLKGVRIGQSRIPISHVFFFADDLILFGKLVYINERS